MNFKMKLSETQISDELLLNLEHQFYGENEVMNIFYLGFFIYGGCFDEIYKDLKK